jgi:hypothetical protein
MIAAARRAAPGARGAALLDCGEDSGAAQAAIRAGVEGVLFTGNADIAARLADIAAQRGVRIERERPRDALDLADRFVARPEALYDTCLEFLRTGSRQPC